jgi:D-galactarolactone cycloisomerase
VRRAIGPEVDLAVDANHAYRAVQAVELGRRLTPFSLAWLEEPVSPEDLDGYCEVRARQPIPVAGGELHYTRFGFRELLERRACDILQPDLCLCGGLSEGRAIADMARAHHTRCWAHVWGTGIAQAAALHFLGWLPTESAAEDVDPVLLEWDLTPNPLREDIVPDRPRLAGGQVPVPTGPGLGMSVDRQALERYQVAHSRVTA